MKKSLFFIFISLFFISCGKQGKLCPYDPNKTEKNYPKQYPAIESTSAQNLNQEICDSYSEVK